MTCPDGHRFDAVQCHGCPAKAFMWRRNDEGEYVEDACGFDWAAWLTPRDKQAEGRA